jgi:hypothetical protein
MSLSVTRAADRTRMAAALAAIAATFGASFQAETGNSLAPRRTYVTIERDGCAVHVSLDGDSRVGAFLGHWVSDRRLSSGFCNSINPFHRMKATSCVTVWDAFTVEIEAGLRKIADGSAFETKGGAIV